MSLPLTPSPIPQVSRCQMTSANLLGATPALRTTTLAPAPPSGYFNLPLRVFWMYKRGTVNYTAAGGQQLFVNINSSGTSPWIGQDCTGFLDQSVDMISDNNEGGGVVALSFASGSPSPESAIDGKPLLVFLSAALTGGGDGFLDVICIYVVVPKAGLTNF